MKVIWAINPAESTTTLNRHAAQVVKLLSRGSEHDIVPVYIFGLPPLGLQGAAAVEWGEQAPKRISARLDQLLSRLALKRRFHVKAPVLIEVNTVSVKGQVDHLLRFAREQGAGLILCQSQGKTGFRRFFMGSFAETLLFRSQIPVLVVGHHGKGTKQIRNILFPTEFSRSANASFHRVLELAKSFGAKITVFHAIELPVEAEWVGAYPPFPQIISDESYIKLSDRAARRRFAHWEKIADASGVKTELVVDRTGRAVWKSVARAATKAGAELIAMEAQSGPLSALLMGSVTRQVVRGAGAPVWVLKGPRRVSRRVGAKRALKVAA